MTVEILKTELFSNLDLENRIYLILLVLFLNYMLHKCRNKEPLAH